MRIFLNRLYQLSAVLAAASIVAITLIICGQVVFNLIDYTIKLLYGHSYGLLIPSYVSMSGYALAFATFLSLGLGLRQATHIRVTLLETRLPRPIRRVTLLVVAVVGVALGVLFVYSFAKLTLQSYQWGDQSVGLLKIPLWIPQLVMSVGALVFLVAAIDTLVEVLRQGDSAALISEVDPEEGF